MIDHEMEAEIRAIRAEKQLRWNTVELALLRMLLVVLLFYLIVQAFGGAQ